MEDTIEKEDIERGKIPKTKETNGKLIEKTETRSDSIRNSIQSASTVASTLLLAKCADEYECCSEYNDSFIKRDNDVSGKERREFDRRMMCRSQTDYDDDKSDNDNISIDLDYRSTSESSLKKYSENNTLHHVLSLQAMDIIPTIDGSVDEKCVTVERGIRFVPNETMNSRHSIESSRGTSTSKLDAEDQAVAWDMYDKEFQLAMRDREISLYARLKSLRQSCIITLIIFICHCALSCLYFCVWKDDWTFRDGLYFSVQTMTTVGYGTPVVPDSQLAHIFVIFQLLTGIAILSLAISEVVQWVQIETSRMQFNRDNSEIAKRGLKLLTRDSESVTQIAEKLESLVYKGTLYEKVIYRIVRYFHKLSHFFTGTELGRNLALCLPLGFVVLLMAVIIGPLEGWGFVDSIYFSVVTLATVGYGDKIPKHPISLWVNIIFMIIAVVWLSFFYVSTATYYLKLHHWNIKRIKKDLAEEMEKKEKIERIMDNSSSHCSISEQMICENTEVTTPKNQSKQRSSTVRRQRQTSSKEVFAHIAHEEKQGPITERRLSIQKSNDLGNSQDSLDINKPSIMIRAQIIKRVAIIITHDLACQPFSLECRQNRLVVEYPCLNNVMEKWMIPRTAREAFQETVFKIICHVGINNLTSNNIEILFNTPFLQVQEMVNPFIAALKNTITMDTWITCTNILAQELEPHLQSVLIAETISIPQRETF